MSIFAMVSDSITQSITKEDEELVRWIVESSSDPSLRLTLSPLQKRLGMTEHVVLLAASVFDFAPFPERFEPRHENRFARLQSVRRELEPSRSRRDRGSAAAKNHHQHQPPSFRLSPRMRVENDAEREAWRTRRSEHVENRARSAERALTDAIAREENASRRGRERNAARRRRKREARKRTTRTTTTRTMRTRTATTKNTCEVGSTSPATDLSNGRRGSAERTGPTEDETSDEDEDDAPNSETVGVVADEGKINDDDHGDGHVEEEVEERGESSAGDNDRVENVVDESHDDDNDDDDDKIGDVYPRYLQTNQPRGHRNDHGDSSVASGSYLQAATTGLDPSFGVETDSTPPPTTTTTVDAARQRVVVESIQQVQLKAFIAETRATAATERTEELEELLRDALTILDKNFDEDEGETRSVLARRIRRALERTNS